MRSMFAVERCSLPVDALLGQYDSPGIYTDCYRTDVIGAVAFEAYVSAFYTTRLFKLERVILQWVVSRPSSDTEATQMANGNADTFAAWHVEGRSENQLLLSDFRGRTRSWLMVAPVEGEESTSTRLFFGSAVTPGRNANTESVAAGPAFSMLLGFHRIYSVLLLCSARTKLKAP